MTDQGPLPEAREGQSQLLADSRVVLHGQLFGQRGTGGEVGLR
jgi:hypothetical protein